ncbi:tonB-system energizer ExbB [Pseudomonas sp. JS3066]|uniref:tonB-system energizer ExbB n=1 Tax=unclassified Pseudomonas TaxID=196821 RepID=UPI00129EAD58|nr:MULTISPECIES: tonB-system energizer ExbB [unclassified Pseudomonas]MDH4655966.1 tonB-system energizer ExbB [Pseudomonas sp. BN606]MRK21411.1 tonB-system energizer ExbB [Pseudomonas sp. JG-B]WVK93007.1 tonB-system energizer ExbB [Pseudomonas sp. JS3066]
MKSNARNVQPNIASRPPRLLAALLISMMLVPSASFAEEPAAASQPAAAQANATNTAATPAAGGTAVQADAAALDPNAIPTDPLAAGAEGELTLAHDLSPWGMYQNADIVVKAVMIGLALASVLTWTVWIAKGFELLAAKRRLRRELGTLKSARTLNEAGQKVSNGTCISHQLVQDAQEEVKLSSNTREKEGIKERVSFRLERLVAASGRQMSQGTGVLATIGSTAPFVGLFGTVWGIMNSFIGIAKSQTTNLAVVAPGIAEALLATALGLVAAIPAVVIYNVFARSIAGYKAQVSDASAQVLLLVSRDLDHHTAERGQSPQMVKVG